MAKSNEPIWWSLFSAGGVVTAFFIPVTIGKRNAWQENMSDSKSEKMSKEYIRPMPADWWLKKKTYFLFMVRGLGLSCFTYCHRHVLQVANG